jgi:hypothetical protein
MQRQERNAEFYTPIIRTAAAVIFLWVLRAILIRLPMIRDLTIPDVQFTGPALVKIVIAVLMIVLLVNLGREFGPGLRSGVRTFPQSGTILDSFVYVACVVIAYDALSWPAQLLLEQDFWVYRWIFFVLVVPGIYRGGVAFYKSIDDITTLFTKGFGRTEDEMVPCGACSHPNPVTASFCSECGAALEAATSASPVWCAKCEAENPPEAAFCTTCGAKL